MGQDKKKLLYRLFVLSFVVWSGCASHNDGALMRILDADKFVVVESSGGRAVEMAEESLDRSGVEDDGDAVRPEPEKTAEREIKELKRLGKWEAGVPADDLAEQQVTYDFPVTVNRQVEYYLDFFQNKDPENFRRWLQRSGRYLPMIRKHLKEAGLPLDLVYLAMIESGFNERAYSRARAMGLWQFIKATGRHYDLTINSYVDERRDPIKSTRAAVAFLSDLYQEFGSWYLAVAGYNAGEGRIRGAIRRYKSTDFWDLAQGRYLRLETKRYVPKLIAAIIIAREPEKYGFGDVEYEQPLAYETIEVPRWTALKAVALAAGVEVEDLREINRELRKPFTPPDNPAYLLKVPVGKGGAARNNLPRVHASVSTRYKTHAVRQGESLGDICRRYGLTKTIILKANNLRSPRLVAGQRLRIPFRTTSYELLPEGSKASGYLAVNTGGGDFILHRVLPGETVSEISGQYNVPVHLVAAWNDLQDISRIRAGQQLALYVKEGDFLKTESPPARSEPRGVAAIQLPTPFSETKKRAVAGNRSKEKTARQVIRYRVQRGDSLWLIARRYRISSLDIKRWNKLENDEIFPGNRLVLKVRVESGTRETYYRVRQGDSLWTIARRHNLSLESIKRWNNLKGNKIYPGNRLLLKLAKDA